MKNIYKFLIMTSCIFFCTNLIYSQNDLAITNTTLPQEQYTKIPLAQTSTMATGGVIENIGTAVSTNVVLTVTVLNSSSSVVYSDSTAPQTVSAGTNIPITFSGFTPTAVDTYTTTYNLTLNETDQDTSNNTISSTIDITSGTYARDNDIGTSELGIGPGTSGQLGQEFDILVKQDIISVTFELYNLYLGLDGTTTYVTIWDMVSNIPNSIVAQTETVTINGISQRYTANITGGVFSLNPGKYLVAIEEGDPNISLATTPEIFTLGTTWVKFPSSSTTWQNNEDFGYNVSYIIRPNFQDSTLSLQENQINNSLITIYPNPSSDFITISGLNKKENYRIYNVLGAEMNYGTVSENQKINIQNLSNGIYILKFNRGSTLKFIKI
jgi:Secretion system C-terminal sorting domain